MKHLTTLFKSIYKNDAVIDGARSYPWWLAILFFLISSIISVIPMAVSTSTVSGASFLKSPTFYVEEGLESFSSFLKNEDLTFDIKEVENEVPTLNTDTSKNSYIHLSEWNKAIDSEKESELTPLSFKHKETFVQINPESKKEETVTEVVFEVFNFTYFEEDLVKENINRILVNKPILNALNSDKTVVDEIKRTTSFMILSKESYAIYKFSKPSNKSLNTSVSGDYDNQNIVSISEIKNIEEWKTFLDRGYLNIKTKVALVQTSIMLAVNSGISLLMGLMVFIITRGKNNPFRIFKIWECFKIGFWAMLSPALLTLIVGFIFPQMMSMMYVLFYGIRMMWLSMKNLKPVQ